MYRETYPSDFQEGDYLVTGSPIIDLPSPIIEGPNGFPKIVLFTPLKKVGINTYVEDYNEAPCHLLAVAKKVRDYAAYVTKARLPLNFEMVGKRPYILERFKLIGAVFDGVTHLPLTDGGQEDVSIFRTRFGPSDGVKPPSNVLKTVEQLNIWLEELNVKLTLTQNLLSKLKHKSPLDVAVSSLGESIWLDGIKEQLTSRWRALEAITQNYNQERRIKSDMIFKTIRKHTKAPLTLNEFNRLRRLRNDSTHSVLQHEQSADVHQAAYDLFHLAYELTESALHEKRDFRETSADDNPKSDLAS